MAYRWKVGSIEVYSILQWIHLISKIAAATILIFVANAFLIWSLRFFILLSLSVLNLVSIGPKVKKWQQILEIQDGGVRHLSFAASENYICLLFHNNANHQLSIILSSVSVTSTGQLINVLYDQLYCTQWAFLIFSVWLLVLVVFVRELMWSCK